MAKPITDDEIQLRKRARRRLVGAIALVLVVVVVLPWLVDDEPPPQLKNVDISIPPVESADRKFPPAAPVGEPLAAAPGESAAPAPETTAAPESAPPAAPEPVAPAASPQPEPAASAKPDVAPTPARAKPPVETLAEPKPEAQAAAKPASKPDAKPAAGKGFIMQVGAFSTAAKAKQVQQQLKSAGVASFIEPVETPTGTRHRVKAGPFASNEAALKAREKLQAAKLTQGDPKVVPLGQ